MKQRGFGLLELLIFAGLIAIVALGIQQLLQSQLKATNKIIQSGSVDGFKKNLIEIISDEKAWTYTVADTGNPLLACVRNGSNCSGVGGRIRVRDAGNTIFYDPHIATSGITSFGGKCSTYDSTNGNDRCPIRYDIRWDAVCTGSPCLNPQVKITGTVEYKPKSKANTFAFNTAKYSFEFIRSSQADTAQTACLAQGGVWDSVNNKCNQTKSGLETACTSMGGVYDSGTEKCTLPLTGTCPAGQYVSGFSATGTKICTPFATIGSCPAGEVVTGFDASGAKICSPNGSASTQNLYQCPTATSANGVSSGPWASYGCVGQIWGSSTCRVVVFPQTQDYACTYVGKVPLNP